MEPYEVAPGIWSTDATARVFGYLSTNDKKPKSRAQSAEPNIQAPGKKAKRKPVPIRGPLSEYEQARFAKRLEERPTVTIKDEPETLTRCKIERCGEERIKSGSNWSGARRQRMRTVSRDDQLVERGANPRTGLVSPFIVSDDSEERLRDDYITVGEGGLADPSPRRTRSGKWKQDSLGWSLVESPLLSPIAQSTSDKMSRTVSVKQLEDRLLVEMPGVDNPEPKNMTDEQIKKYQEGIARAYRRGGGSLAMLDPDTLPSPRKETARGPSTPPAKLHQIQRKEVGSGVARQRTSGDTVIVRANNQAPPLSTPRENIMKRQEVRIFTPSNTPKGSSFESGADISNTVRKTDPFLGPGSRETCSQTASATQSQSYLNTGPAHQCLQNDLKSSPSPAPSDPPSAFPTLDRYLPRLQIPHPSRFANLETSSYRRPTQLLRARLSPLGQQRQVVEDACTTTFTTTSKKGPKREQRPKIQRQEGDKVVPRVTHSSPGRKIPLDGYYQTITPRNKPSHPSAATVGTLHTLDLVTGRSRAIAPTKKANPAKDLANTRHPRKTWIPADCLKQAPCGNRPRNLASPTQSTQGLSLGSANVTRERIQGNQSGDGSTLTYGLPGKEYKAVPGVGLQNIAGDKEQAILPAELTVGGESRAWFAGQWADVQEEGQRLELNTLIQKETLGRRPSILRREADVKLWMHIAEAWAEPFPKLGFILRQMIGHVMRTLHHASPAFIILRTAKTTTRDRFRAIRDLVLATLYLLLLLNLFMALKRVLFFVGKVLYWIGHPVQTIFMIVGWCIIG